MHLARLLDFKRHELLVEVLEIVQEPVGDACRSALGRLALLDLPPEQAMSPTGRGRQRPHSRVEATHPLDIGVVGVRQANLVLPMPD